MYNLSNLYSLSINVWLIQTQHILFNEVQSMIMSDLFHLLNPQDEPQIAHLHHRSLTFLDLSPISLLR